MYFFHQQNWTSWEILPTMTYILTKIRTLKFSLAMTIWQMKRKRSQMVRHISAFLIKNYINLNQQCRWGGGVLPFSAVFWYVHFPYFKFPTSHILVQESRSQMIFDSETQSNDILLSYKFVSSPTSFDLPSRQWTYRPLGLKLVSVDAHFYYRKLIHFTNEVARGRRNGFWVLWRRPKISCKLESVVKWRACSQLKI